MRRAFWEWVATREADDDPRGDFIRDTRDLMARGLRDPNVEIMNGCQEALDQFYRLAREWERKVQAR